MQSKPGFTLLEVLLAIVLLAVVVGVSVPYLRGRPDLDVIEEQSLFHARVAEALATREQGRSHRVTVDDYMQLAQLHAWDCQRLERNAIPSVTQRSFGEWVVIRDEAYQSIQWAQVEPVGEPVP